MNNGYINRTICVAGEKTGRERERERVREREREREEGKDRKRKRERERRRGNSFGSHNLVSRFFLSHFTMLRQHRLAFLSFDVSSLRRTRIEKGNPKTAALCRFRGRNTRSDRTSQFCSQRQIVCPSGPTTVGVQL